MAEEKNALMESASSEDSNDDDGTDDSGETDDDGEKPYHDVECYLPFKLQDFCLITIINELDCYPIELLALLPRHLRYRLLSNVPNYDLNRLDHTPIAAGIDTDELWKAKTYCPFFEMNRASSIPINDDFYFATPFVVKKYLEHGLEPSEDDLLPCVVAAMKKRSPKELYFLVLLWDIIKFIYSELSSDLFHLDNLEYTNALDGLAAVRSHEFQAIQLPRATEDLPGCRDFDQRKRKLEEYKSNTLDSYRRMWGKQATPFARCKRRDMGVRYDTHLLLIPQHLLPIHQSRNVLELLNHLVVGCDIRPLNLSTDVDMLYSADSNLKTCFPADATDEKNYNFVKAMFGRVVLLELLNIYPENVHLLHFIIESIVKSESKCALKVLELGVSIESDSELESERRLDLSFLSPFLCTLPNDPPSLPHYQGLNVLKVGSPVEPDSLPYLTVLIEQQHSLNHVYLTLLDSCQDNGELELKPSVTESMLHGAFSQFVSCTNFKTLTVSFQCRFTSDSPKEEHQNVFPFSKLLHSFILSPCANKQILQFEHINSSPPKELAPLVYSSSGAAMQPPDCGTEHKLLTYDPDDNRLIFTYLIQLPIIQLQELVFMFEIGSESLFSQLSHHPNLKVNEFRINFKIITTDHEEIQCLFSTLCQDFERIFQICSLKKFCLLGNWLHYSEIKKALVVGLHQQAQVCSLQKLYFGNGSLISTRCQYSKPEFRDLWSAIFTLPQVDRLEFEVASFANATCDFVDMVDVICECQKEFSAEKKKLKSIQLSLCEDWNFSEIWKGGKLDPFKTVTHSLDILLKHNQCSPDHELLSYF